MGWFRERGPGGGADTGGSADPRHRVVSVLRAADGRSAGAGVVLTRDHLLTCAHVVNDALGKGAFEAARPDDAVLEVRLRGPAGQVTGEARVIHWLPPRRLDGGEGPPGPGELEWAGDLAVLRFSLAEPSPGQRPAGAPVPEFRAMCVGQAVRAWHGSAHGGTFAEVRVRSCDGRVGYLDGALSGMAIGPGYSGGPLWSDAEDAVVGLVAAALLPPLDPVTGRPLPYEAGHPTRRSWGIPWQRIEDELRAAGAGALLARSEPDGAPADPAEGVLADLLAGVFPTPVSRGEFARAVAERCGLSHPARPPAPTTEEFARVLVTEERALAALTEALRSRDPAAVESLLKAGRLSPVPRLLSPREHERLRSLLDAVPGPVAEQLPEAVRAALPMAAGLPHGTVPDGELLGYLEQLTGDSRSGPSEQRVPGLLRAVEFVAVLCPAPERARLRLWADGVAARLGIPTGSLRERRADAEEWARGRARRGAPPRLLVHLATVGADAFRLRLWCDDGTGGGLHRTDTGPDRDRTAAEAAREVLRELARLCRTDPDAGRPVVEVLVDRDGLEIPVDEWEFTEPGELVPGVLGAEYALVVHCPELLRRNERFLSDWRHRWDRLESAAPLRLTGATQVREVYGMLLERRDAARVSVEVPAPVRREVVQVCLAMGVPVVLWDRAAAQDASPAVRQVAGAPARALPEQVRSYRAKTLHHPSDHTGRPVLAWADPDRALPELQLSEPTEAP
ncbi:serine protease (plasmid) [Streptomyces sp. BHT-5-2]|uniref:VMAP-C domain-containing protein n=1 Tax=Streptomyces sp. BHT-5-2 TaxID=2866715 RepID=UPI001C8D7682|nr:trypsin-like peptidase domain-containing protein [Streptomyces sp. BHT-5-2]QZL07607.1 serine protease [Streptomyces sp. BHT-5-2]